jgi:hypothetical protein
VKPPPDGIGKQGTAAQSEEPDSVRDVIPAARQEGRGADRTST